MKKTRKIIISTISIFIMILSLIAISNTELIFAKEDNVYYLDELQIGQFIPNGTTLVGVHKYYTSGRSENYAILSFSGNNVILEGNNTHIVKEYEYYASGISEKYNGWIVDGFDVGDDANKIYLSPSNKTTELKMEEYEIIDACDDNDNKTTSWYKSKEITDVVIETTDKSYWNIDENSYGIAFEYGKTIPTDFTAKISFKFSAKKGDYLSINYKQATTETYRLNKVNGDDYIEVEKKTLDHSNFKQFQYVGNMKIEIKESGEYEFIIDELSFIKYNWPDTAYFYLKNPQVISIINNGNKLDETNLDSNEELYYECKCSNGYIYKDTINYHKQEEPSEEIKNPETNGNLLYIGVLLTLFTSVALLIKYNSEKLSINKNE